MDSSQRRVCCSPQRAPLITGHVIYADDMQHLLLGRLHERMLAAPNPDVQQILAAMGQRSLAMMNQPEVRLVSHPASQALALCEVE